jgi:hypothetical protein
MRTTSSSSFRTGEPAASARASPDGVLRAPLLASPRCATTRGTSAVRSASLRWSPRLRRQLPDKGRRARRQDLRRAEAAFGDRARAPPQAHRKRRRPHAPALVHSVVDHAARLRARPRIRGEPPAPDGGRSLSLRADGVRATRPAGWISHGARRQVLLLDEATSALDAESEVLVQEAIDRRVAAPVSARARGSVHCPFDYRSVCHMRRNIGAHDPCRFMQCAVRTAASLSCGIGWRRYTVTVQTHPPALRLGRPGGARQRGTTAALLGRAPHSAGHRTPVRPQPQRCRSCDRLSFFGVGCRGRAQCPSSPTALVRIRSRRARAEAHLATDDWRLSPRQRRRAHMHSVRRKRLTAIASVAPARLTALRRMTACRRSVAQTP